MNSDYFFPDEFPQPIERKLGLVVFVYLPDFFESVLSFVQQFFQVSRPCRSSIMFFSQCFPRFTLQLSEQRFQIVTCRILAAFKIQLDGECSENCVARSLSFDVSIATLRHNHEQNSCAEPETVGQIQNRLR